MAEFFENYLGYLLARGSYKASSLFHQKLKEEGIPILTWRILACIQNRSATVNELAERVLASQSTLSKALDRLESDNLIRRKQDQQHRRKTNIAITKKGSDIIEYLIPLASEYDKRSFEGMQDSDKAKLQALLHELISHNNK